MRFTHANRHCSNHPYHSLIRCDDTSLDNIFTNEQNIEVLKWLERYRATREDKTPKRKSSNDANDENQISVENCHNNLSNPKSRKGLMYELDMNAGQATSPISSKMRNPTPKLIHWNEDNDEEIVTSPINPKKRWLRDAWQEDLAKPLEPTVPSQFILEANQNRSSVLMIARKDQAAPLELSHDSVRNINELR